MKLQIEQIFSEGKQNKKEPYIHLPIIKRLLCQQFVK